MAMGWIRALRDYLGATARAPAQAASLAAATEFLRPSRRDLDLPNQAAEAKARALLERSLTPEQRRDLLAWCYFYVRGKRFTYRIRQGCSGNVDQLDQGGRVITRFCAQPLGRIPIADVMLAQKLWIENDEDMFLMNAAPYPLQHGRAMPASVVPHRALDG